MTELRDFDALSKRNPKAIRLEIGPWAHAKDVELPDNGARAAGKFRTRSLGSSLEFFDALENPKGIAKSALEDARAMTSKRPPGALSPPVSIFVMGANVWRDEYEFPLARTQYTKFFLDLDSVKAHVLSQHPPVNEFEVKYAYDPANPVATAGGAFAGYGAGMKLQNVIEVRKDVISFSTDQLKEDVEVTGPVSATVYVKTDAPCTDFTAKLVDVYPDGRAYNLCSGILRRNYSAALSKPEKIKIDLVATSNVFRKGHRIRLDISSSDFPRFDRNLNTGGDNARAKVSRIAHQTICVGREYPSHILLPIIPTQIQN